MILLTAAQNPRGVCIFFIYIIKYILLFFFWFLLYSLSFYNSLFFCFVWYIFVLLLVSFMYHAYIQLQHCYIRCQSLKYEHGFYHWRHLASCRAMNINDENLWFFFIRLSPYQAINNNMLKSSWRWKIFYIFLFTYCLIIT